MSEVTFTLSENFDKDIMDIVIRGANGYSSTLELDENYITTLDGLVIPDGEIHFSVEHKNNGGGDWIRTNYLALIRRVHLPDLCYSSMIIYIR